MESFIIIITCILGAIIFFFMYDVYVLQQKQKKYVSGLSKMDKLEYYDYDTLEKTYAYFLYSQKNKTFIIDSEGETISIDSKLIIDGEN